mmetsp:Transcript_25117/g.72288  ORF Transcript_25117/g.72288 Transcript_25117/m.72288 type:complete len:187 (-) Transcript_25117:869-1429(-)
MEFATPMCVAGSIAQLMSRKSAVTSALVEAQFGGASGSRCSTRSTLSVNSLPSLGSVFSSGELPSESVENTNVDQVDRLLDELEASMLQESVTFSMESEAEEADEPAMLFHRTSKLDVQQDSEDETEHEIGYSEEVCSPPAQLGQEQRRGKSWAGARLFRSMISFSRSASRSSRRSQRVAPFSAEM